LRVTIWGGITNRWTRAAGAWTHCRFPIAYCRFDSRRRVNSTVRRLRNESIRALGSASVQHLFDNGAAPAPNGKTSAREFRLRV